MNIKFYSPSYKRWWNTKTNIWCKDVIFCVHDFEKDTYHWNKIILSDDCRWNMAKVRNEILDKAEWDYFVMLDDDIKEIWYFEDMKIKKPTFEEIEKKIFEIIDIMEDMNTVLWWFNLQSDPQFYREYSPLSFLSPVLWPFMIIKKNNLRFDNRLWLNEDYDYALQVLHKYWSIVRNNKWHYKADHINTKWWCGAYRTMEREKEQANIMKKKWWSIVKYDFDKSTNPIINIPITWI